LIANGYNNPTARITGKERERELQELRKQMKGSGLKDSRRHAYHVGIATPAEYERNKAKMPRHGPLDRFMSETRLVQSQLHTLANQARQNPGVEQTASINRDGDRHVQSITALPNSDQTDYTDNHQAAPKLNGNGNSYSNFVTGAKGKKSERNEAVQTPGAKRGHEGPGSDQKLAKKKGTSH
jgi:hypothetical protein